MSEALRRRKANALDLTIVIGNPKDDMEMDEEKERNALGLAPDAEPLGEDENAEGQVVDGSQVSGDVVTTPNDRMLAAGNHPDELQDKQLIDEELSKYLGKGSLASKVRKGK